MARQPRFTVTPTKDDNWAVKKGSITVSTSQTKERAVEIGKRHAKAGEGQLVIHKQNGRIQTEHTYGNDPKRRKG